MSYFQYEVPKPSSLSEPINREPGITRLVSNFITPNEDVFDRNHGPIPHLSAETHLLAIDGIVATPLVLSIPELEEFPQTDVTSTLQCGGNRRNTMGALMKPVHGVRWNDGAIANCTWSGVLLRDVLLRAGVTSPFSATSSAISNTTDPSGTDNPSDIRDRDLHVHFYSSSSPTEHESTGFGGSITLSRALDPSSSVLLALRMNNQPLPISHGYPLRVIVPGQLGARSVKWLDRITISVEESFSHYQRRDYKVLPESISSFSQANGTDPSGDGRDLWASVPSGGDMPVNSAIGIPASHSLVTLDSSGLVEVRGYAIPASDCGPIVSVEVSADEGQTWHVANLSPKPHSPSHNPHERPQGAHQPEPGCGKWTWTLFHLHLPISPGQDRRIWSRARDSQGNTQQRFAEKGWNLRGLCYNGYGEARGVTVV